MKESGYRNTFILVAADCPAERGVVPASAKAAKPAHVIQYELLSEHPYKFTQDELLFEVHLRQKGLENESAERQREIRDELFSKPHPCLRASMLPKKFGWGVHYDAEGRIALYAKESPEYQAWAAGGDGGPKLLTAMRNKRA